MFLEPTVGAKKNFSYAYNFTTKQWAYQSRGCGQLLNKVKACSTLWHRPKTYSCQDHHISRELKISKNRLNWSEAFIEMSEELGLVYPLSLQLEPYTGAHTWKIEKEEVF